MYTTTLTGAQSTSELDARFESVLALPTTDAFGRPHPKLLAEFYEALSNAWSARDREFKDSAGSARHFRLLAVKHYRDWAAYLETLP